MKPRIKLQWADLFTYNPNKKYANGYYIDRIMESEAIEYIKAIVILDANGVLVIKNPYGKDGIRTEEFEILGYRDYINADEEDLEGRNLIISTELT